MHGWMRRRCYAPGLSKGPATPNPPRSFQSDQARASGFTAKLADFGLAKVMDPNGQALLINRNGAGERAALLHCECRRFAAACLQSSTK
jgi:hypothetical protein